MQVKIVSDPLFSLSVSLHCPFFFSLLVFLFFHIMLLLNLETIFTATMACICPNTYKIKGCNGHKSSHVVINQSAWYMHTVLVSLSGDD